jgi:hypothetical protein
MNDKNTVTFSDGTSYVVTDRGQYLKSTDKYDRPCFFVGGKKQAIYLLHKEK